MNIKGYLLSLQNNQSIVIAVYASISDAVRKAFDSGLLSYESELSSEVLRIVRDQMDITREEAALAANENFSATPLAEAAFLIQQKILEY